MGWGGGGGGGGGIPYYQQTFVTKRRPVHSDLFQGSSSRQRQQSQDPLNYGPKVVSQLQDSSLVH